MSEHASTIAQKHGTFALLCMMMSAMTLFALCPPVNAATVSAGISYATPAVTVNITDENAKTVTIAGNVSVDTSGLGSNIQEVQVELTANTTEGAITVTPQSMVFQPTDETKPFTLSVNLPAGIANNTIVTFGTSGTAMPVPGATIYDIPKAEGTITVLNQTEEEETEEDLGQSEPSPGFESVLTLPAVAIAIVAVALWEQRRRK